VHTTLWPRPAVEFFPVEWKPMHFKSRIKRKLREVYRLNKSKIYSNLPGDRHMDCMLIYVADKELSVADLESSFQNILDQWAIQSV
jgi:hypothetical protein